MRVEDRSGDSTLLVFPTGKHAKVPRSVFDGRTKLPKHVMSTNKMIETLEAALADLASTNCTFWACEGPARPRHMVTCTRCWGMRELQKLLRHLYARKRDE